jgi:hypothetical protein
MRAGREKATCVKRIASPGGRTWRFSDGTLADVVVVGAHVHASAELHSVGSVFLDAIHPNHSSKKQKSR